MYYSWDVIGHENTLHQLEHDVRSGNMHHAYLFVGPSQIGKFRVAKSLAGILQCPNDFCHKCPSCLLIDKQSHPDTIELIDDGESVKIATIRDIIARLSMTPQSNYKILMIENFSRLSEEAANALLKILEEPPGKTLFFFTANHMKDVIPTVASRMRILQFKKLRDPVLKDALHQKFPDVSSTVLDQILFLSLGRSGQAIKLLSQPEMLRDIQELYEQIDFLETKASLSSRVLAAQTLAPDYPKTVSFLSLLAHHIRQKMLRTESYSERTRYTNFLEMLNKSLSLLDRNINAKLVLENLMTHL